MQEITLMSRLKYAFDNTMSKGAVALIGWLAALSALVILLAALLVTVTGLAPEGSEPLGFAEALWGALMRMLDSGAVGGDVGWSFRIMMLFVTFGGIFILSTLIGLLTSGIESKLDELRKGRSTVIEEGHTIILGWSQQIFSVISELLIANQSQKRACIVVMADKDKVEMEEEIRAMVGPTGRTRIVCRRGSPISLNELEIVNPRTSRSIIILSPEEGDADSSVIKTVLALTNSPNRRHDPYHIVAEMRDPSNLEVAKMVGRDEVELILVGDLISRIIAQTCRQSGLSIVYTELLDFSGDEIYFQHEPSLVGKTFREALFAYEDSIIIGLEPQGGQPVLNPPMSRPLAVGDRLVVIAHDDDTIRLSATSQWNINRSTIRPSRAAAPQPEKTLVLGWNWRGSSIINELDNYVASGSEVTVVAAYEVAEEQIKQECDALRNQQILFQLGETANRRVLDSLQIERFDRVIVLCYADAMEIQQADAQTLITLLHLRDIADKKGLDFAIISEMLDVNNRALAEVARADDFVVSDKLISLMLAQVSENKSLNSVFSAIFSSEGSEIYLKPVTDYVKVEGPLNFYTILEAAAQRDEVAIGYRLLAQATDASKMYGVVINPQKSEQVQFSDGDRVIVLANS